METISFEQLAEKLNGKLWIKGDLKRIYLDEGFNTKKMSTKTYVYEKQDGSWGVSCRIECPSQNDNWIISQEDKVIEDVEKNILEIIELSKVELVDSRLSADETEVEVKISYNGNIEEFFLSETQFDERFNRYPRSVFENLPQTKSLKITQSDSNEVLEFEKSSLETQSEKMKFVTDYYFRNRSAETNIVSSFEIGATYNHTKFGNGVCESEDETSVVVNFPELGSKKFIKQFVKLSKVV